MASGEGCPPRGLWGLAALPVAHFPLSVLFPETCWCQCFLPLPGLFLVTIPALSKPIVELVGCQERGGAEPLTPNRSAPVLCTASTGLQFGPREQLVCVFGTPTGLLSLLSSFPFHLSCHFVNFLFVSLSLVVWATVSSAIW